MTPAPYLLHPATSQGTPRGTLVVLPGVNSGPYLFKGIEQHLKNWHIWLIHPPGTAGMPLRPPFSAASYASHVAALLKGHTGPVSILGHSLGSFAAQELTRQLTRTGQPPSHLMLVSSSPGQPTTAQDVARLQLRVGRPFWTYMKDMETDPTQAMQPLFGSWPTRQPKAYQQFMADRRTHAVPPAVAGAQLTAGGLFSSLRWVHTLRVPTLVVHGQSDILVASAGGRMLARLIPGAKYHEYPDCGHFPMLEAPSFYPDIAAFLNSSSAKPPPIERRNQLLRRLRWPYGRFWR